MNQNELIHYGIPGMRWGRRKATMSTVVGKKNSNGTTSETSNNAGTVRTKNSSKKFQTKKQRRQEQINNDLKSMSDKELRDRINRMQMEQQYTKLMTPEKSAAQKQIQQILINEGKQIATQMVREEIKKSMKKK